MAETRKEKWQRQTNDPATFETCIDHILNGGCLSTLASLWDVHYADIVVFVQDTDDKKKRYVDALQARNQLTLAKLLHEINKISFIDSRKLYNDDGSIKKPSEWPDELAAAVAGVEVVEIAGGVGCLKKVKLYDKLKALEMLGRDLGRFVQKHELSGKVTLEDLVTASQQEDKAV